MGKPPNLMNMKQTTPTDQLWAILFSMEGHLSNFEENIIIKQVFVDYTNKHIQDIKYLEPFLNGSKKWDDRLK